jgi:hypothetical protein
MRLCLLASLLIGTTTNAQVDLPVFGKQQVINGYAKDVEGEVLSYFSVYPEHATTALLTRCTDGKKAIAWETAPVTVLNPNDPIVLLLQLDRSAQQHHQRRRSLLRSLHQRPTRAHLHYAPQHEAGFVDGRSSG